MSSYYKPKTKKLGQSHYRKYIVPIDCDEVVVISQEDDGCRCVCGRSLGLLISNFHHPLVNAGEAYWLNKTQLCTGYTIGNVFRTVFNYKREKFSFEVREDIVKYAKILASKARHALYKKELMKLHNKKIPEVLVDYIANYAWDIMLLL